MAAPAEQTQHWHAELAWTRGRVAERVTIAVADGRIVSVEPDTPPPADAIRLAGITIPGLANPHSHALHRALRGRTQTTAADFWSWRQTMYDLVDRLDPDLYHRLARATYAEMALAGITAVGEFHYLHHDHLGARYADPNAMGEALIAAAQDAGVRLTLIDTCYLQGGVAGGALEPSHQRFSDGDAAAWAERVSELRETETVRIAAAVHSVRAVDPPAMAIVRDWARETGAPLHVHASEQPRENEECLAVTGMTPTELLAGAGVLGSSTTVVHATHVTRGDIGLLGGSGSTVCLCPTTERDLGDGIGPARDLADAGARLTVASDMHAAIDMFEELRALEVDQRLVTGRRGLHSPGELLKAATETGARSIGWPGGGLAEGEAADFLSVDLGSPRTAGADTGSAPAVLVHAATAADVRTVVVGGRTIVEDGRHTTLPDVGRELGDAIAEVFAAGPPPSAVRVPAINHPVRSAT